MGTLRGLNGDWHFTMYQSRVSLFPALFCCPAKLSGSIFLRFLVLFAVGGLFFVLFRTQQKLSHAVGGAGFGFRNHVGVNVLGGRWRSVSEVAGNADDVHALEIQDTRRRVPEGVRVDMRQVITL